jgi:hypothetical protein
MAWCARAIVQGAELHSFAWLIERPLSDTAALWIALTGVQELYVFITICLAELFRIGVDFVSVPWDRLHLPLPELVASHVESVVTNALCVTTDRLASEPAAATRIRGMGQAEFEKAKGPLHELMYMGEAFGLQHKDVGQLMRSGCGAVALHSELLSGASGSERVIVLTGTHVGFPSHTLSV